jgi:trimeric autotransporter adhesin
MTAPSAVAVDASGNIYIADTGNNRIRLLTASDGKISTFAGSGVAGYSGDTKDATSAQLNNPQGLVLDSSGNLYIADSLNNVIRMVTVNAGVATITTYAGSGTAGYSGDGGPATAAELMSPQGLTLDTVGNLYVADGANHVIRMVTAGSGAISTVAGTGTAGYSGDGGAATLAALNIPSDVALDTSGIMYIADSANNAIRKVSIITGSIETFAGTGIAGYYGDGGVATYATMNDPRGVSTGFISTYAGTGTAGTDGDGGFATSAQLNHPAGVAVDGSGSLYIADSSSNRIRAVYEALAPTAAPTLPLPTYVPTTTPTRPTAAPTHQPTSQPTDMPSATPTRPTAEPTYQPTKINHVSEHRSWIMGYDPSFLYISRQTCI